MAKTYGPTGEGVKPTLGVSATMGDTIAKPGAGQRVVSGAGEPPEFASPASSNAGDRKPSAAGAEPDFASPGGPQGWSHGKK